MDHDKERDVVDIVGPQVINYYVCDLRQQVEIQRKQKNHHSKVEFDDR